MSKLKQVSRLMKEGTYSKPSHAAWDMAKWDVYDSREELESDLKILKKYEEKQMRKVKNNKTQGAE